MSEIAIRAVCGAGLIGPVVLAVVLGAGALRPQAAPLLLATLGAIGAVVLAAHTGASLLRAWRVARAPSLVLIALALCTAPLVVARGHDALELVVTIANVALPLHVSLQLHRVAALLARPRSAHVVAAILLALAGVIAMCAGPREPLALRGSLSLDVALPIVAVLVVVAVAIAASSSRSLVAALAYGVAGAAWVLPLALGDAIDPRQTSLNAFAIGHGVQLVWLALFVDSRAARQRDTRFDGLAYCALALALGALLLVDVPWLASRAAGVDLVTALVAVQATVALAHIVIDAIAFRMRDVNALAALEPAPSARPQTSNARAIAFVVPGAVVVAGLAIDALQTWLTRPAASDDDLVRAELLHPHDARLLLPRAVRALAHDDRDEARAALGAIAHARAFSPETARARLLLCALELDAPSSSSSSLSSLLSSSSSSSSSSSLLSLSSLSSSCLDVPAYLDDDAEVLAMTARMALASGDVSRAKKLALRAVERAPDEPATLAALGIVEAHLMEATAREHLERALALQKARIGGRDPLLGDASSLDAGVALAQAYEAGGDKQRAHDVASRVVEGATNADRPRQAMRALAVQGHVLEARGDARGALDAYQRALHIASFASSPADEAALWIDYGILLERSQATEEAVFACTLKAKALVDALPHEHPQRARLLERATTRAINVELVTPREAQERVRADVDAHALFALQQAYGP